MTERSVFLAALDISDPDQRAEYLAEACTGNPGLRAEVEALLQSYDQAGKFLESPAAEQLSGGTAPTLLHPDSTANSDAPPRHDRLPHTDGGAETDPASIQAFLQPSTRPDALGRLGHYEILEILGRGAFGIVAKAFDESLHRIVAIKLMNPELAATSPPRKRFLREARTAAQVRHENIVHIYAIEEQPLPYLAMEYIPGQTLQQRLDSHGPLDVPDVLRIGQQIAAGLAAAHAVGLIHRDIKPANILLESGIEERVKITDFGLARAVDDASLTQSGIIAGTPMYMAPEQARGELLDHRADLFSLGSVLYVMVSGRPPFRAPNTIAVLKRVCEDTPRPVNEVIPGTPPWLCDIITKLHAKNPDERYQSAMDVADALGKAAEYLRNPATAPQPVATPTAVKKENSASTDDVLKSLRGPGIGLIVTACLNVFDVIGLLLAFFIVWSRRGSGFLQLGPVELIFLVIIFVGSGVILIGGFNMLRGRSYGLSMLGSVAALLVGPMYLVGWPVGIWALVVLTRPQVREFFQRVDPASVVPRALPARPQPAVSGWLVAAVVIAMLPVMMCGLLVLGIAIPAFQKARIEQASLATTEQGTAPGSLTLPDIIPRSGDFWTDAASIGTSATWTPLFNGTDLTGWQANSHWIVENGALVSRVPVNAQKTPSMLVTERKYFRDFHARIEFKINDGGDSGFFFRFGEQGDKALQAQITAAPTGIGSVMRETTILSKSHQTIPPNTWTTMEVVAQGPQVSVYVNGSQVVRWTESPGENAAGPLAFEAGFAGTEMAVRKIEVKPLPGSAVPQPTTRDSWPGWTNDVPPPANYVASELLFEDTFDNREKHNLYVVEDGKQRWAVENGVYSHRQLANAFPPGQGGHGGYGSSTPNVAFALRARGQNFMFSFLFGQRGEVEPFTNLEFLLLPDGKWFLRRRLGLDSQRDVANGAVDAIPANQWFTLFVQQIGPRTEVMLNGKQLCDATETDIPAGNPAQAAVRIGGWVIDHTLDGGHDLDYLMIWKPNPVSSQPISPAVVQTQAAWHGWPADAPKPAIAPFDAAQAKQHQEAWAKYLGVPVETTNSIGAKMILIPPGEFLMGAVEGDADATPQEKPQHRVRLTKPFAIGATEVTHRQFRQFVQATKYVTQAESDGLGAFDISPQARKPSNTWNHPELKSQSEDESPVRCVSWEDARRFCEWLTQTEGHTYRLPTEAEWEFACRAGTATRYSFGNELSETSSPPGSGGAPLQAVAQLPANPFGLFDMHGNVNEICWDSGRTYAAEAVTDPLGSLEMNVPAVVRGGAVSSKAARLRSSNRYLNDARQFPETNFATMIKGFRVVRDIAPPPPIAKAPIDDRQARANLESAPWVDLLQTEDVRAFAEKGRGLWLENGVLSISANGPNDQPQLWVESEKHAHARMRIKLQREDRQERFFLALGWDYGGGDPRRLDAILIRVDDGKPILSLWKYNKDFESKGLQDQRFDIDWNQPITLEYELRDGKATVRLGGAVVAVADAGDPLRRAKPFLSASQSSWKVLEWYCQRLDSAADWQPLFNGKDLAGWRPDADEPSAWRVEEGVLVGAQKPSYLFSERDDFTDFHLRAEVQINNGGDGGIIIRAPFEKPGTPGLPGYEAQIQTGEPLVEGWATGAIGSTDAASGWRLHVPTHKQLSDRWFTLEVIARGNEVETRVNGEKAASYVDPDRRFMKGRIALQQSGANTRVMFRKIAIRERLAAETMDVAAPAEGEHSPVVVDLLRSPDLRQRVATEKNIRWDNGQLVLQSTSDARAQFSIEPLKFRHARMRLTLQAAEPQPQPIVAVGWTHGEGAPRRLEAVLQSLAGGKQQALLWQYGPSLEITALGNAPVVVGWAAPIEIETTIHEGAVTAQLAGVSLQAARGLDPVRPVMPYLGAMGSWKILEWTLEDLSLTNAQPPANR